MVAPGDAPLSNITTPVYKRLRLSLLNFLRIVRNKHYLFHSERFLNNLNIVEDERFLYWYQG